MRHFGGRKCLLFFKAAAWVFGVLTLVQCGLKLYFEHPLIASAIFCGQENVIGEADGPTSIFVSTGFGWGISLSYAMMLSFALFLVAFVGTVFLNRKQKREARRRRL